MAAPLIVSRVGRRKFALLSARLSPNTHIVDFLLKVEAVKDALRSFAPNPYSRRKALTHLHHGASVSISRAVVLGLAGWSNTQFAYWARRVEAIATLAAHDPRLHAIALVLEYDLSREAEKNAPFTPTCDAPPYVVAPSPDHIQASDVSGRCLGLIIDDVKQRTGASQYVRGKQSSLDPFHRLNTRPQPLVHNVSFVPPMLT